MRKKREVNGDEYERREAGKEIKGGREGEGKGAKREKR